MKLMATAILLVCLPALGQETRKQEKMGPPGEMLRRQDTLTRISKAIEQHQPFALPENSLDSNVVATATGVRHNGDTLEMTGVEITTSNIVVTADEVIYDWDTHQIEPRGNVRLRSATRR